MRRLPASERIEAGNARDEQRKVPQPGGADFFTGNGEWTYRVIPERGKLPAGIDFGGTHGDFDGRFVRTVTEHLRRPCQISFYGDYAVISEIEDRAVILDRDNVPVAFLGDNSRRPQWANYDLAPSAISAVTFSAAHGCFIDEDASIYISDWNKTGRITKLARIRG